MEIFAVIKLLYPHLFSEQTRGERSVQPVEHKDILGLLPARSQRSAEPAYAESEEIVDEQPREMSKADMQRDQIVKALRRHGGSRRAAAAELFMSERTLYRKIKELGITDR